MADSILNKKVVVFDFDGTIVDSMGFFADIASKVIPKHYNVSAEDARKLYISTSGLPFFEQLETIFPGHKANSAAAEEYETIKEKNYLKKKVFDDAAKTIEILKRNNIKVAVSSNNFQPLVDSFLTGAGISFDIVLGYRKNFAKGPDHFKHIIGKIGCKKEDITFIGDSLKDAEHAKSFGIDFIGKEGTFSRDEFSNVFPKTKVISSLSQLKEFL